MDKKVASNVTLGIFLAVALASFVFILFNISGGRGFFTKEYILFGRFQDTKGLHYGSEVSLSGLRVGVVKSIFLDHKDQKTLIVEMAINNQYQDQIRKDSKASLKNQGLLGDRFIQISIGSSDQEVLKSGETIETALTWAPINSMSVVQQLGAQAGLLRPKEVEEYIAKAPEWYKAEEIHG
jgi:phospholipid/cholesterol/gamma-HCH transport system substrate-binding protein